MKITITHNLDTDNYGQYAGLKTEVVTNSGNGSVNFSGGEPEDFSLTSFKEKLLKIKTKKQALQ